ncbi:hypothetical protein ACF08W_31320, partial [Streptomyces sp. NPDC015144]
DALALLAKLREEAGDQEDAERLAREAADHGDIDALALLAKLREEAGDQEDAERLAREAADHGDSFPYLDRVAHRMLARLHPHGLDPDGAPTPPWQ